MTLTGEYRNAMGVLINGSHDVVVRMRDITSHNTVFQETHTSTYFNNGHFSIQFGSLTTGGIPSTLVFYGMYAQYYYIAPFTQYYDLTVEVPDTGRGEVESAFLDYYADESGTTWTGLW